jgi:hypothetical protein
MARGIRKVGDDSGSVYDTEWYKESVVKAERGNREHIAKYDRSFAGIMAKGDAKSRDLAAGDDDDGDIEKQADHHASTVADLLVEAGSHPDRATALQHLLHKPSGQALLSRMSKKETTPMKDTVHSIMKDCGGPVAFAKTICDTGRSYGVSEQEYVEAAGRYASELCGLPSDRAFAKLYEEESVRRACSLLKAAEFSVFDLDPVVVGGPDAMNEANDDTEQSAVLRATEEIQRIGRKRFPFLPQDQQFARVFEDKNYAALAAQAHRRPGPTTVYAMPRAAAYAKSDPAPNTDTAYAELMAKAEQLRSERPELSVAQCFEKIYTDRGNVELAKRERVESAPR